MPVTMKDVAARAGVTPTVVSRVLHNKAQSVRVSEATAERVRQAAAELGYRVNIFARNFRERQTMMIGVLHGIGFGRPRFDAGPRWFAALMDGLVDGAFEHGYSVTLCPKLLGQTPEDAMADGRFDGLVWYSSYPTGESRALLERCSIPLVVIHATPEQAGGRFPTVICDNDQGVRLAVDHLAALGHRRIAFALQEEDLFSEALMRGEAFHRHMREWGLESGEADVIDVRYDGSGAAAYFEAGLRHTAVIGSNDGIAAAFILRAPHYGIEVPHDFSVVGFDSTSYCDELRPALTSVHQPIVDMGRHAANLLVQSINGEAPGPTGVVLPCGLDVRASTDFPGETRRRSLDVAQSLADPNVREGTT